MTKKILLFALILVGIWGAYEIGKQEAPPPEADDRDVPMQQHSTPSSPISGGLTTSQQNAVREARSYLAYKGYSRQGLINQLSSDGGAGYSTEDATAAVDSLSVNWDQNALRAAKAYLRISGFSCNGLILQLSSSAGDGFSESQAEYGARNAGVCN